MSKKRLKGGFAVSEKKKPENEVAEKKPEKAVTHTVAKGDTVYSIAQKYLGKTSRANEIRRANNLVTDVLRIGKVLVIPEK